MQKTLYELEWRVPTSPRSRSGKGMTYMDPLYRAAQYEFRTLMLEKYGHFDTILATQPVKESVRKGRAAQPRYRNVLINYLVMLADNSQVDQDNISKFLYDSLAKLSARQPTKKDLALGWIPLFENDRQVIGGQQIVVDNWPYNHLQFEVVRLDSPAELTELVNAWEEARPTAA